MALGPDIAERLNRARADLRAGVPVVMTDAVGGALVLAAETLDPLRFEEVRGMGSLVLAITGRRAGTLRTPAYDGDISRISVPRTAGVDWIGAVADPASDLDSPMKGPFLHIREGDAALARAAISLVKSARLLPSALIVSLADAAPLAAVQSLTVLPVDEVAKTLSAPVMFRSVVHARLPMSVSEAGRLHVFRPEDGGEEHYAVEIGQPPRDRPVLARLHSACFTGDLLGSLKCDCGPQLRGALAQMGAEGAGVLLYLNQEGRGIGLANKMRAYSLQDQGFDTVEANHRLGFEDDERDFRHGAAILKLMGFQSARLMTNNPAKIRMMEANGISVTERVPLKVGHTAHNADYLATKATKSGHLL